MSAIAVDEVTSDYVTDRGLPLRGNDHDDQDLVSLRSFTLLLNGFELTEIPMTTGRRSNAERRRWYVHLGLLACLAASLLTLITLSHSITAHVIFGVLFMVLLCGHLYQRRRTVRSLLSRLVKTKSQVRVSRRVAVSDTILVLLVLNVLISGVVDAVHHQETQLPFLSSLGYPAGLVQWHKLAAFILVIYAIVHVVRRRKRLRHSRIQ